LQNLSGQVLGLGETLMNEMLTSQKSFLDDEISQICVWRRTLAGQEVISRKRSVHKLRHTFHRLGSALASEDIPEHIFFYVVSCLAKTVFDAIIESIITMEDISEDICEQIPLVFEDLIPQEIDKGILSMSAVGRHGAESEETTYATGQLLQLVPQAFKLKELCQMLCIPSREIAMRWKSGHLEQVGFNKEEVLHLVHAIFEDTKFRQESLQMIEL